ncbi:MAG TPA: AMP-binding protein [Solirubrobacterales bacterium]|nr:AMP-binding protein [Solirubrobacterales bacterium]
MNLYAVFDQISRQQPDAPFVRCEEEELSYGELAERVAQAAALLRDLGVGRGDRVATLLRNRILGVEAMYACAWLGAIWAPVNWRLAVAEWEYVLRDLEPSVVIVEDEHLEAIDGLGGGWTTFSVAAGPRSWTAEIASRRLPAPPPAMVGCDHPARVMYTSGTTSHPKGAVISHANILFKNAAYSREFDLGRDDVVLLMGPMFHVGGLDAPGIGIADVGGRLVILPAFSAPAVLETIEREGVTVLWSAPTMTEMLLTEIGGDPGARLDSVRVVVTGSSQSAPDLLNRALVGFPKAAIDDGYGMTESASGSLFIDVRERPDKIGTVGSIDRPMMYEQIRVVGDDGNEVGPDEPGEVQIAGAKLFQGYWRNEEATRAAFTDDGWYRSGDLGELDQDRFLRIVDRRKDMIKSGGENIGSAEIERVIVAIDGVVAATAVAAPDPKWGEVPAVFVELAPGAAVDAAGVKSRCADELAKFKVPKYVHFVDSVPRTSSGKARKTELRLRAAELATEQQGVGA